MARYAVIENGIVVNVIEWDGVTQFDVGAGRTLAPIDDLPNGVTFPMPVPVSLVVTSRQARLALLGAGLLDQIDALIAGAGRPDWRIFWEYSTEFHEDHPLMAEIGAMAGLSAEQRHALFQVAASL